MPKTKAGKTKGFKSQMEAFSTEHLAEINPLLKQAVTLLKRLEPLVESTDDAVGDLKRRARRCVTQSEKALKAWKTAR